MQRRPPLLCSHLARARDFLHHPQAGSVVDVSLLAIQARSVAAHLVLAAVFAVAATSAAPTITTDVTALSSHAQVRHLLSCSSRGVALLDSHSCPDHPRTEDPGQNFNEPPNCRTAVEPCFAFACLLP
jgi:hypothetical protein